MIEVYGQDGCFYCKLAQDFLECAGLSYEYIDVSHDTEAMRLFRENSFRTVPQIYIDNHHIGGYDELREYYKEAKL